MVLGLAFSCSIPMVFISYGQPFDLSFYLLISANFLWVVIYDTAYAMSDREDDLKIGVKSTAILFAGNDRLIIGVLQLVVLLVWGLIMVVLDLDLIFLIALTLVAAFFAYQQWLMKERQREPCFRAFLNNTWVGATLWLGLISSL